MPSRSVTIAGVAWQVVPSGFVTQSDRDEYGVFFVRAEPAHREVRLTRYSPAGSRGREADLAAMSDAQLARLFGMSQPAATAPETGYHA